MKDQDLSTLSLWVLRLKRSDGVFFRRARRILGSYLTANLRPPGFLKPLGRCAYDLRMIVKFGWKHLKSLLYVQPLFSCRCESVGKRLQLIAVPAIHGHTRIVLGDDVHFSGNFGVASGRFNSSPLFQVGDRVFIGHNVGVTCNRQVVIEDDVLVAENCTISDSDGHPIAMRERLDRTSPFPGRIAPVRVCKGAWICAGSFVLKGVTIGEGSVVGANSVVTRDVLPHTVVAGSPARFVGPTSKLMKHSRTLEMMAVSRECLEEAAICVSAINQ